MEKIERISKNSKEYPPSLKRISDAPEYLYVRGEMPRGNYFAVVGTRHYSSYGKQAALEITNQLAKAGLIIVSGLASGIDSFCHEAAIEADGKTIAVLGTGIDDNSIYPKENLTLAKKIINGHGCLISELPPGSQGFKSNFPARNRIISGLSSGVLIIEARQKSGALITASWAKGQKRKVFALPGSVFSPNSWGANSLIKTGAKLVQSADDILEELNCRENKNLFSLSPLAVGSEETKIISILTRGPLHLETITETSGLRPERVCSILAVMEIDGKIRNLGGGNYGLISSSIHNPSRN